MLADRLYCRSLFVAPLDVNGTTGWRRLYLGDFLNTNVPESKETNNLARPLAKLVTSCPIFLDKKKDQLNDATEKNTRFENCPPFCFEAFNVSRLNSVNQHFHLSSYSQTVKSLTFSDLVLLLGCSFNFV